MRMWLDGPYRDPSEIDAILRSQVAQMQREAFQNPIPNGAEFLGVGFVALERLKEIACPVLVVAGDRDFPIVTEHASLVASRIPHARFQLIRDVGHMLSLEVPARFSGLLRDFIEGAGRTHPASFPIS